MRWATVTGGLTAATALGAPIGTFIGGVGNWRTSLWFVAALGLTSMIGLWKLLHAVPQPAPITLREGTHVLAGMFLIWGVAATAGNILAGHLVDRYENRRIINAGLCVAIINFCALPWTSGHIISATTSLTIWGLIGWGLIVPQQHRLVKIAPQVAPLLLALNNTAIYVGLACSGVLGGLVLLLIDPQYLSLVGAGLIAIAFALANSTPVLINKPMEQY